MNNKILKEIIKIGIVVNDLDKTIKNYINFSFTGPWIIERNRGNSENMSFSRGLCKLGNIYLELIQPLDSRSIFAKFIREKGEGLHHLTYRVENYDDSLEFFKKNNIKILTSLKSGNDNSTYFIDTQKDLKQIVEVSIKTSDRNPGLSYIEFDNNGLHKENTPNFFFKEITQIGILVKDVKQTVEKYNDYYGIGPWGFYNIGPDKISNMTVKGIVQNHSFIMACTNIGEIEIELIQALDDKSIYGEFINDFGESLHHVCFTTPDYHNALSFLKDKNLKIIQSGEWNKCVYVYFSSYKDLKCLIELYNCPSGWKRPDPDYVYG